MSGPAILLIILGVILGPGSYYGFCEYLSGEKSAKRHRDGARRPLDAAGRDHPALPQRARLPAGGAGAGAGPEPAAAQPDLRVPRRRRGPAGRVRLATLLDQDYPAIEQPLWLRPTGRVDVTVRTFEVQAPGKLPVPRRGSRPAAPGASVTVHLRGRIERPVRALMWTAMRCRWRDWVGSHTRSPLAARDSPRSARVPQPAEAGLNRKGAKAQRC